MALSETLIDWLGTFWKILISPTPQTFMEEADKANNKISSAVGWIVFVAFYSYSFPLIRGYAFNFTILIYMLLLLPFIIILVPSATHFVLQRVFHRKQYLYDKVLYIFAAILVLFQIITIPITVLLPSNIASAVNYALIAYQFLLFVIALKSIANIKYWQAAITVIVSAVVGALIVICGLPFITSLMGSVSRF